MLIQKTATQTCYLHVGTHKTGTTSLQAFLTANAQKLADAGVAVPHAGRPTRNFGAQNIGHHNLAWEAMGDARYDPDNGTFADAVAEIARLRKPTAILSAEGFEFLHARHGALERWNEALAAIDYRVKIVLYLRPQAEYAESLYAGLVRRPIDCSFDQFLEQILTDGAFHFHSRTYQFDYPVLVKSFGSVFGAENIIVRPYLVGRSPNFLYLDFLRTIGSDSMELDSLYKPERLNQRLTWLTVLAVLRANACQRGMAAPQLRTILQEVFGNSDTGFLEHRFDPLTPNEQNALIHRFATANEELAKRYRLKLRCTEKTFSRAARKRRQVLDAAMQRWR